MTTSLVSTATVATITGSYNSVNQSAQLTVNPYATTGVTLSPATLSGGYGSTSTATVTISAAAPSGGTTVSLSSSNTGAATVPATVLVPQGSTSAQFTVSTSAVSSSSNVTITAGLNGATSTATLTVNPYLISTMTVSPTSVYGAPGVTSTGTINLNSPAPSGGLTIGLSSSSPSAASVPSSVLVAAGTQSVQFTVTTALVSTDTPATITAALTGNNTTANLTVKAYQVTGVSLSPTTVIGTISSAGSVTINGAAPPSGMLINLSSSNTGAAQVPSTVLIAANATSANFTVTTNQVNTSQTATITGSFGTSQQTATLSVTGCAATSVSISPNHIVGGNVPTGGTVTLTSPAPAGGAVVALSSSNAAVGVPATVNVAGGSTSATFAVTTNGVDSNTPVTISATYGATQTFVETINPATLYTLTVSPTSVMGGSTTVVTGNVHLNGRSGPSGTVVTLSSSNTSAATLPATVTIPANTSNVNFTVTTYAIASNATVTLTATLGTATLTTPLTVTASALTSVTTSPASIVGGNAPTGTVTLNGPAPAAGAVVTLSSANSSLVSVPATVTVAGGAKTATFPITTSGVNTSTPVVITAVYNGTQTATLTLQPAVLLNVTVLPTSAVGGPTTVITGNVKLNGKNGASPITVNLTSSDPTNASVPTTVTIPANVSNANFSITSAVVSSNETVTITATYNGGTQTATLTLMGGSVASVVLNVPSSIIGGGTNANVPATLTLQQAAPTGGAQVRLTSSAPTVLGVPMIVTVPAGQTSVNFYATTVPIATSTTVTITANYGASFTTTETVLPWGTLTLGSASIVGGSATVAGTITLSAAAPAGGSSLTLASDNPNAAVPGTVTVAEGQTTATFNITTSVVTANATANITGTWNGINSSAALTIQPYSVTSVVVNPASVYGGNSSQGTVTLNAAAPTGGLQVSLASGSASATPPATVTVAHGATTGQFAITTTAVASDTTAAITATYNGANTTANLTVQAFQVTGVVLNPTSVFSQGTSQGTVTLTSAAPTGGVTVSLAATGSATVPSSVTVASGNTTATFTVTAGTVSSTSSSTITASLNGGSQNATLQINPYLVNSVSLSPSTVIGSVSSTGTVTINGPAGPAGVSVTLTSSNPNAQVTSPVTVTSGNSSANFTVTTNQVNTSTTSTITAAIGASTQTGTLSITGCDVSAVSISPTQIVGGNFPTGGTVTLSSPAPAGGAVVALSSNNAAVGVPASVTVLGGSTTATFAVTTTGVDSNTPVVVSATYGLTQTCTETITPARLYTLTSSPTSVVGGSATVVTYTVRVNGHVGPSGLVVNLTSSNTGAATVPATVTIPAQTSNTTFRATTYPVSTTQSVTITASATGSTNLTSVLSVVPGGLASIAIAPTAIVGGNSPTGGTVTLSAPAPAGGAVVTLTSANSSVVSVPASVTVAQGASSATFAVTTSGVDTQTQVVVTGKYISTQTCTETVNPASLMQVTVLPTSAIGGPQTVITGNVHLNGKAGPTPVTVTLTSSDPTNASVLGTVTIPANTSNVNFTITSAAVSSNENVTIGASYNSVNVSTTLQLTTGALASVSISPSSVVGGSNPSGTVTLQSPAPAGGAIVRLTSSNASIMGLPMIVTVPAGQTTMTFTATTVAVTSDTTITITGICGATQTCTETVTVSGPLAMASLRTRIASRDRSPFDRQRKSAA